MQLNASAVRESEMIVYWDRYSLVVHKRANIGHWCSSGVIDPVSKIRRHSRSLTVGCVFFFR